MTESTGISINFCGSQTVFRGTIATISADSLASRQIGGFRQSFSSGKVCRHCLADCRNLSQYFSEADCVIRTTETHSGHLNAICIDQSCCRTYGVKSTCVFDQLCGFSVFSSMPSDVMHDILEGFCVLNMQLVLQTLIRTKKLTLSAFNDRLDMFVFAKCDIACKPPHLPDDFVGRGRLLGSASQNWCLFCNLPFLVSDCIDYESNNEPYCPNFWQLHLLAREICKIVFAPAVRQEWLLDLQQLIIEHHTLLAAADGDFFTPKVHFLIHYPRLIEIYGPLRYVWCMQYEASHQYYKKVSRISNNYKNIALTLAERHQFKACWSMSGANALKNDISISARQSTLHSVHCCNTETAAATAA